RGDLVPEARSFEAEANGGVRGVLEAGSGVVAHSVHALTVESPQKPNGERQGSQAAAGGVSRGRGRCPGRPSAEGRGERVVSSIQASGEAGPRRAQVGRGGPQTRR